MAYKYKPGSRDHWTIQLRHNFHKSNDIPALAIFEVYNQDTEEVLATCAGVVASMGKQKELTKEYYPEEVL